MPSGSAPGTVHQLQDNIGNLDRASLLTASSRTPSIYRLVSEPGEWFFSSLLVSKNSAGNFKQEIVFWSSNTRGRQDIMRSKMDDLLQLLLARDQEVGEDGGQHVKTSESIRSSTQNKQGEWLYLAFLSWLLFLCWSEVRLGSGLSDYLSVLVPRPIEQAFCSWKRAGFSCRTPPWKDRPLVALEPVELRKKCARLLCPFVCPETVPKRPHGV